MKYKKTNIRPIVVFGNVAYMGQERANTQIFSTLQKHDIDALFLINDRYSHWFITPRLDELKLNYTPLRFPEVFRKGLSLKRWLLVFRDLFLQNYNFLRIVKKEQPTHLHFCNDYYFMCLLPALLLTKVPIVFRLGDAPLQHIGVYRFLWRKLIAKRVNCFVCNAQFVKRELMKFTSDEHKIQIIYNWVGKRQAIKRHSDCIPPQSENLFTVVYMGQLIAKKGIDLLIDAILILTEKHDNIRLIVAGGYEHSDIAKQLMQMVEERNKKHQIIFAGMVHNISKLLQTANVLIAPSVYEEPLANVVIEAKEEYTPSIIFPSGGLPEVISHKIDGYICKDKTAADIIEAIEYFYTLADWGKAAGEAAYKSLEVLGMTEEVYTQKWLDIYAL